VDQCLTYENAIKRITMHQRKARHVQHRFFIDGKEAGCEFVPMLWDELFGMIRQEEFPG
jgi:hypothetical protein